MKKETVETPISASKLHAVFFFVNCYYTSSRKTGIEESPVIKIVD